MSSSLDFISLSPFAPLILYSPLTPQAQAPTVSDLRALLEPGFAGTYTIERELGRGGMATVFLARDLKHHRPVALKALYPHLSYVLGPERFRREIELLAALTHPHI